MGMRSLRRNSTRPVSRMASKTSRAARSTRLPGISGSESRLMLVERAGVNATSSVSARETVWKTVRSS